MLQLFQLAAEDARGDGAAHRAVQQRAANLAIPMRPQVQDAQDVELVSPADDLVVANGRAEFYVADSQVGQRRHAPPRASFSTPRHVLRTTLFARIYRNVLPRPLPFQTAKPRVGK